MRRKLLPLLFIALIFAAGCTRPAPVKPGPEQPSAAGSAFEEIRIVTYQNSPQSQMLDVLIAAFQDRYTRYRVTKIPVEYGDTFGATVMEYATTGAADVMPLENGDLGKLRDAMQPLEPLIAQAGFDLSPLGPTTEHLVRNGHMVELPYACSLTYLVYNKELLEKAGIAVPPGGWTWEEFRQVIHRLTEGQGEQKTWGLQADMYHLMARAYVEEKSGLPLWKAEDKVVVEAMQYFAGLVLTDQSAPRAPVQEWDKGRTSFQSSFVNEVARGKAAIGLETYVAPVQLTSLFPGLGALPFPTFAGTRPVAVATPYTFGIPTTATNPEGAWQFVRFAAGPEGAAALARAGFQPMYLTDSVHEAAVAGGLPGWDVTWTINRPLDLHVANIVARFTEVVGKALSGAFTLDEAHSQYIKGTRSHPKNL